jgi:hypothetical protein
MFLFFPFFLETVTVSTATSAAALASSVFLGKTERLGKWKELYSSGSLIHRNPLEYLISIVTGTLNLMLRSITFLNDMLIVSLLLYLLA